MWEYFTQTQVSKHLHEVASGLASVPAKQTVFVEIPPACSENVYSRGTAVFQDGNVTALDLVLHVLS